MSKAEKAIVVTGVSRGLGHAMTEAFIERGHTVLGCARSSDAVATLARRWPAPHRFRQVDVADDAGVAAWAQECFDCGVIPDLLVNNAALINASQPLWEVGVEEFSRVVDVNIKGVANVIRHFLPSMIARGAGVVVNFSSGWGRSTSADVAPYCATKWAIEGLTQALAQELPRGIAAVPLNPGVICTEMLESCFGETARSYPGPAEWATSAVPFILQLGAADNGKSLTVPGAF